VFGLNPEPENKKIVLTRFVFLTLGPARRRRTQRDHFADQPRWQPADARRRRDGPFLALVVLAPAHPLRQPRVYAHRRHRAKLGSANAAGTLVYIHVYMYI